jgi:diaminopimelate epimerase
VSYLVDVPGGRVEVELTDTQAYLSGPAVLVAYGEVAIPEEG